MHTAKLAISEIQMRREKKAPACYLSIFFLWNRCVHFIAMNLLPMNFEVSERASEWTNERSTARERSMQGGASEWVSSASKQANRWVNDPRRVNFIIILPTEHSLYGLCCTFAPARGRCATLPRFLTRSLFFLHALCSLFFLHSDPCALDYLLWNNVFFHLKRWDIK